MNNTNTISLEKLVANFFGGKYNYYCPHPYKRNADGFTYKTSVYDINIPDILKATKLNDAESENVVSDFTLNEENTVATVKLPLAGYGKSDTKVNYQKVSQDYYSGDIYNFNITAKEDVYKKSLVLPKDISLSKVRLKMEKGLLEIIVDLKDNSPQEVEVNFKK